MSGNPYRTTWHHSDPYRAPNMDAYLDTETGYNSATLPVFINGAYERVFPWGRPNHEYAVRDRGAVATMAPGETTYTARQYDNVGTSKKHSYYWSNDRIYGNDQDNVIKGYGYMKRSDNTTIGVSNLGEGFAWSDQIFGGKGNDKIYGYAGDDLLDGGEGNDTLYGGDHNDQMAGGVGNDVLYGEAHHDRLFGGAGNDTIYGGSGNDYIHGGTGADVLYGGAGVDIFAFPTSRANFEVDRIKDYQVGVDMIDLKGARIEGIGPATFFGENSSIMLHLANEQYVIVEGISNYNDLTFIHYGDNGNNRLTAIGTKNDVIRGLDGNDTITGGAGNDMIEGGAGSDTASYADVTVGYVSVDLEVPYYYDGLAFDNYTNRNGYILAEVVGNTGWSDQLTSIENIIGTSNGDVIKGDTNANRFDGGAGSDILDGRGGNDVLVSGQGSDILIGGAGADTFIINGGTLNRVTDLSLAQGDQVQIDRSVYTGTITHETRGNWVHVYETVDGNRSLVVTMDNLSGNDTANIDSWLAFI